MKRIILSICVFCAALACNAQNESAESYTSWRNCVEWPMITNDRSDDVPLAGGIRQQPGYCGIIHKWGFIGDSLCSGEFEYADSTGKKYFDMYEYSWGQRMCAYMGAQGDNYSCGGLRAERWAALFWDGKQNKNNNIDAKTDPKQAYVIALGVNDIKKSGIEVFSEWYPSIIEKVRSIQPDCKIFVVTMPRGREGVDPFNELIRSMADKFPETYVIDLYKYAPDYSDKEFRSNFYLRGHLNAQGYDLTAWMMLNYIDWIIRHNMKAFSQVGFIGTEYYTR